ncbi:MAG: glycosyltransferase family 4 protein [Opitutaceae bacterium]|nr:glycosyltransferase family 4 protein [Opitutaceae bacterium]
MRIALVQDHLRVGGTERQTASLARAFAAAGHEVLVVTFRPGGTLAQDMPASVRSVALQPFDLHLDWFAPGLVRTVRAFAPDVVQLMGRMANCHGARLVGALPGTRVVATFRTGKRIPWLYRRALRRAAAVVVNSAEAARRIARDHGVAGAQVHVIRNALAATAAPAIDARGRVRAELSATPDTTVFLCTAMLRPGKGHRRLVRAAAALPRDLPWVLWIAGDGTERGPAESLAHELGLGERVRFLGLRRDTADLYAAADVAVLASDLESLPNFLVEAQWLGLPVAACDVAGVGETFLPGASGLLVPQGDHTALAGAMERLARDPALRGRMAVAAREHARSEFDPDRQNARYLELFAGLRR